MCFCLSITIFSSSHSPPKLLILPLNAPANRKAWNCKHNKAQQTPWGRNIPPGTLQALDTWAALPLHTPEPCQSQGVGICWFPLPGRGIPHGGDGGEGHPGVQVETDWVIYGGCWLGSAVSHNPSEAGHEPWKWVMRMCSLAIVITPLPVRNVTVFASV